MGQGQGQSGAGSESAAISALRVVEGFQLVRLIPHSPSYNAGLTPYFDIITALDRIQLQTEAVAPFQFFRDYIEKHKDTSVCFTVFNLRIRAFREVHITPSASWGGRGILGCSIEWARAEDCVQRCWHIVEVLEGSPASYCPDIHAARDYIIGMQQPEEQLVSLFKGESDFHERLEMWQALQRSILEQNRRFPAEAVSVPHSILLLLYDYEENAVKEVLVDVGMEPGTPLGVNVACGLLHIIPSVENGGTSSLPVMNRFYLKGAHMERTSALGAAAQQPFPPQMFPAHQSPPGGDTTSVVSNSIASTAPSLSNTLAHLPPSLPLQPQSPGGHSAESVDLQQPQTATSAPPAFNPFTDTNYLQAAVAAASHPRQPSPEQQLGAAVGPPPATPPSHDEQQASSTAGQQVPQSPPVQQPQQIQQQPMVPVSYSIPPPLMFPTVFNPPAPSKC